MLKETLQTFYGLIVRAFPNAIQESSWNIRRLWAGHGGKPWQAIQPQLAYHVKQDIEWYAGMNFLN